MVMGATGVGSPVCRRSYSRTVTVDRSERTQLTIRDPQVMRAVAHPARIAILEHLTDVDSATATECASVCGLSPSATSYHLRALAKVGLVEEAPSRGDGRERVWRAPMHGFMIDTDDSDPEAVSAAISVLEIVLGRDEEQMRSWMNRAHEVPKEWSDAIGLTRHQLMITAEELKDLQAAVADLLKPYGRSTRTDSPPGARKVAALFRAFPAD
jgi:DNA-binding transcriptional ArsR family regulator